MNKPNEESDRQKQKLIDIAECLNNELTRLYKQSPSECRNKTITYCRRSFWKTVDKLRAIADEQEVDTWLSNSRFRHE